MRLLPVLLVLSTALIAGAQQPEPAYDPKTYQHASADIPMRDGLKLHVEIFYPANAQVPLPFLFERTPYGVAGSAGRLTTGYSDLAEQGYIFVFQDIRGRYRSEGTFVMQRPPRPVDSPSQAIDEGTDTYDSIEWLLTHVPKNNGRRPWACSAGTPHSAP
jgi:predicted acyl esterase